MVITATANASTVGSAGDEIREADRIQALVEVRVQDRMVWSSSSKD